MDTILLIIIVLLTGVGFLLGYIVRKLIATRSISSAEAKAEHILQDAKQKEKEILLDAKDKALSLIDQAKKDEEARRKDLSHAQQRLENRESLFDQKLLDLENKNAQLTNKHNQIQKVKDEIVKIREQQLEKLEKIAGLSQEQAKNVLLENMEIRSKDDLLNRLRKLDEVASYEWDKKAKSMLSLAMERCASSHAVETTTTS
ncbi:MAG: ribonuclease Y, partial [Parcubacteria group bacterium CG_4_10_14_0_2_um_filter_41_6]